MKGYIWVAGVHKWCKRVDDLRKLRSNAKTKIAEEGKAPFKRRREVSLDRSYLLLNLVFEVMNVEWSSLLKDFLFSCELFSGVDVRKNLLDSFL